MCILWQTGVPVTQRIKQIKQPRGGYIKPKQMTVTRLGDGIETLHPVENVHASLVGLAVDYLTRFMTGASARQAFHISLMGANCIGQSDLASQMVSEITGLDGHSITRAVQLSSFDVCYRTNVMGFEVAHEIEPDLDTIENIGKMVNRAMAFFHTYGPKTMEEFTFEGGYTDTVIAGDGDFLTKDTLWDFKVSKAPVKKEHTLQILMYWRMGLHSIHPEFEDIQYLGIYNPRLNTVSRIAVSDIPPEVIYEVDTKVIGYK